MSEPKPPIAVTVVPVTAFSQNASIVACTETGKAMVVDPGGDLDKLMAAVAKAGVTVEKIVLTHGHVDHAAGAAELAETLGVPIEGPNEADAFLLDDLPASAARFRMAARPVKPDRWLSEGDVVTVGAQRFAVHQVPGHTPGHVVLFNAPAHFALVGDTLFAGSVGRTDFPYGDEAGLLAAIRAKLLPLGDDVTILPGHGPATTIGDERRTNPFLR